MNIFTRKPRLAHQLVGEKIHLKVFSRDEVRYRCSVCNLTFDSAIQANEDQCKGKPCYLAYLKYPMHLMNKDEIEATNRVVTQEPSAYVYNPYMSKKPIFTPLYDVRECLELDDAIPLPTFD